MISDVIQFEAAAHRVRTGKALRRSLAVRPHRPAAELDGRQPAKPGLTPNPGPGNLPATIPLVPRSVAHLPVLRWRWSARRRLAQDHPFGRIAQIEANLEQLVDELEAEVDRLVARTDELLDE